MDPNPFPPPVRRRRGKGGINLLANNDRNRPGQTGGIIRILKKRKNTGRKFCLGHTEWSAGLTTSIQNRGFKVPNFTLFNGEDPHASSVEHIGRIQQKVTISDLAALKQNEDEPAQDFITDS
ncbi:unnamed protein product [Prunus armeniaca]